MGTIWIHGQRIGFEKLGRDKIPDRLRRYIKGEMSEENQFGSFKRKVSDRLSKMWFRDSYEYRNDLIHLSDVSYCLGKAYLRRKYPNFLDRFPEKKWDSQYHLSRGSILHSVVTSLFPTSEKDVTFPSGSISLSGRLDFVDKGIVYDLKWISDYAVRRIEEEGPYPFHAEGPLFYSYCRKYPECRLLYWHSHGLDVYRIGLERRDDIIANLVTRAQKLHDSLEAEEPICEADYAFKAECKYCEFSGESVGKEKALCKKSGDGREIRDVSDQISVEELMGGEQ